LLFSKLLSGSWPSISEVVARVQAHMADPGAYLAYYPPLADGVEWGHPVGGGAPTSPGLPHLPLGAQGGGPGGRGLRSSGPVEGWATDRAGEAPGRSGGECGTTHGGDICVHVNLSFDWASQTLPGIQKVY
jgi:hypothetical protein